MKTQEETYKGFTIETHHDPYAETPFDSWDCEPPLLALGAEHKEATCYNGAPVNVGDVVDLLPPDAFKRGNRVALIRKNLGCSLREFAEARRNIRHGKPGDGETAAAFVELAEAEMGCEPRGWGAAIAWLEWAEDLLSSNGIPALHDQRYGPCQGDSVLLLAIATKEWLDKAGVEPSHAIPQLKGALDLYAAWAFGDVPCQKPGRSGAQ